MKITSCAKRNKRRERIVLVGGGGHCKVVIDAILSAGKYDIEGIVDPGLNAGDMVLGIPVVGNDDVLPGLYADGIRNAFITVGSIGDCLVRKGIYGKIKDIGFKMPVIIHPEAVVGCDVDIKGGTFIAASSTINSGTKIGRNVIINTSSSIDHDCEIGDFVHIAPGVTLSGGVKVGAETHIGVSASVVQNIEIGERCFVPANTLVKTGYFNGIVSRRSGQRIERTFIIAEAGVNHNGSLETAKKMVDIAKSSGADAVKFQTFRAEKVAARSAPKAGYQEKTAPETETQLDMLKKLELNAKAYKELIQYCGKKEIIFISTPFDIESAEFLNDAGLEIFKIPSGGITDLPYLRKIGAFGRKLILSTGMSSTDEIRDALIVLMKTGMKKEDITVLHCVTEYPVSVGDANLYAMDSIRKEFGVNVGYSDHTPGIEISIAAVAMGASVIEKHFTLDKNMNGPDHKASLEPGELRAMVTAVRNVEKAMGDGIKRPLLCEQKNIPAVRKSIVAARHIESGEFFTEENITTKRPATGLNPMKWDEVIGKTAKRCFEQDDPIEL